jgi:hypothetical protein
MASLGVSSGRAKWYAPNAIPLASAPALLVAYIGSMNVCPSVALVIANRCPDAATATQSITSWWCETSIPGSAPTGCAPAVDGTEAARIEEPANPRPSAPSPPAAEETGSHSASITRDETAPAAREPNPDALSIAKDT